MQFGFSTAAWCLLDCRHARSMVVRAASGCGFGTPYLHACTVDSQKTQKSKVRISLRSNIRAGGCDDVSRSLYPLPNGFHKLHFASVVNAPNIWRLGSMVQHQLSQQKTGMTACSSRLATSSAERRLRLLRSSAPLLLREIDDFLVIKICRDLEIPSPKTA